VVNQVPNRSVFSDLFLATALSQGRW